MGDEKRTKMSQRSVQREGMGDIFDSDRHAWFTGTGRVRNDQESRNGG
jgi:hypothetical protein